MHRRNCAALALILSSSLRAQAVVDLGTATPISGQWNYYARDGGSEARFTDANAAPQLVLSCDRSTHRVTISKPAAGPTSGMNIWTSSQRRTLASTFSPATGRLLVELDANDSLLDAMSSSRGRIGVAGGTEAPLVLPPWPELARVVEDCRV